MEVTSQYNGDDGSKQAENVLANNCKKQKFWNSTNVTK